MVCSRLPGLQGWVWNWIFGCWLPDQLGNSGILNPYTFLLFPPFFFFHLSFWSKWERDEGPVVTPALPLRLFLCLLFSIFSFISLAHRHYAYILSAPLTISSLTHDNIGNLYPTPQEYNCLLGWVLESLTRSALPPSQAKRCGRFGEGSYFSFWEVGNWWIGRAGWLDEITEICTSG